MKITEITDEQMEALHQYGLDTIEQAYSTRRCDREKGEKALRDSYRIAGLPEPQAIVWVDSPYEALTKGPVWDEVYFGSGGAVEQALTQVGSNDLPTFRARVQEIADRMLLDESGHKDIIKSRWSNYLGGHIWQAWSAWRLACFDVLGLAKTHESEVLRHRTQECGPTWVSANLAVISDRPTEVSRGFDSAGNRVLHNEEGPAIRWADGWAIWAIEGVRVTEQIVMTPETLTLEQIADENNMEVQRIMRERYGMERWLKDVGAEVIALDSVPIESWNESAGSITRVLVQTPAGEKYVIASDGSTGRVYVMRAPDTAETPEDFYKSALGGGSDKCLAQG